MTERKTLVNASQAVGIKVRTKEVWVPEWDLLVWLRGLTGEEHDEYETSLFSQYKQGVRAQLSKLRGNKARLLAKMITAGEGGARVFDDHTGPAQLLALPSDGLNRLHLAALPLLGQNLDEDDDEDDNDEPASVKNFGAGQDGSSTTT